MSLREAFGSEAGLIIATTLHSVGALAVVAALVTHIAWYRKLRAGIRSGPLRRATGILTLNGIAANLVGGAMRTYLPEHPGLTDIATSPWVQVMVLKHAFIFASLGALIYMHMRVTPRLLRLSEEGPLPRRTPSDHAIGTAVVILGVVVASVLGALAQISPLAPEHDDMIVDEEGRTVVYQNATGSLTSTPLAPQSSTGTLQVLDDFVLMQVTLQWTPAQFDLALTVTDSAGETTTGESDGDGRLVIRDAVVSPGPLEYRIDSDLALDARWNLSVRLATAAANETFLAERVTVAPGTFFEINTQMPHGATLWWDWTSSGTVAFDIHSHFDDEVQYHVEETGTAHKGSFTNDREGGYSYLWANTGNVPVTLDYRAWGEFEVDSYVPPR